MTRFQNIVLAVVATTAVAHAQPRRIELSLAGALDLASRNNQDIAIARLAPRAAAAEVTRQRGAFDPVLSLFAGVERDKTPSAFATYRQGGTGDIHLRGRLATGLEYDLGYGTTRTETDSTLAPSTPSSTAHVLLQLRQPLLRGSGSDVNEAGIAIARGARRIAEHGVRRTTEIALASTVDTYWRLVRAHESLAVARESLQLAERLVEQMQTRVAAGQAPTIDLAQARASVAQRREAVIVGEAEVGNANDALARLIAVDARAVFDVTIVPTDAPHAEPATIAAPAAIANALRHRAEIHAARVAIDNAERALAVASDRRRPDLSAVGGAGVGGLDPHWLDAQSQLAADADRGYRWSIGLVLTVPLGNRSADGAHEQARIALEQARLVLRDTELKIVEEVRTALRNLEASRQRVEATRRATALAREQLALGAKRLESGLATTFEVLRLQTDLATAQNAEIAAAVAVQTSLVRVQLATGALGV